MNHLWLSVTTPLALQLAVIMSSHRRRPWQPRPSPANVYNAPRPPTADHRPTQMLQLYVQRSREIVDDISDKLREMALDTRLMPATKPETRTIRSSASTPSLRSRDGTIPPHARMDGGGNVRVVVRVRAFLPRGKNRRNDDTTSLVLVC